MRVPTFGKQLYSALMFVLVSVMGGILAAGLLVPTAGVTAELAKTSALMVQSLPQELETPPQAEGSKVLMKDGSLLTNFYDENRTYVKLDQIAPVMRAAQVAIEDQRFYQHGALDPRGTLRAFVRTASGNTQGGSTLTQQYVKMVLLNTAYDSNDPVKIQMAQKRTFATKFQELRYALALEKKMSKDEILERYLNLSYYGDGAYGVESAARHYFSTTASKLTLAQAAMLAGLVRNPATTDPVRHEKLALERRENVLDKMSDPSVGLITKAQAEEAKKVPFDRTKVTKTKLGCANSKYPHLCQMVEKTLKQLPSMGPNEAAARDRLYRGGMTIQTEIDPRFQDAAQRAVSNLVAPTDPVISTMVMVQPGTGLLMAAAQSRPKMGNDAKAGETYYAYWADRKYGGAEGVQGGSTFKAFTAAAALEQGIPTSVSFSVDKVMDFTGKTFKGCDGPFRQIDKWNVRGAAGNYDMYSGATHSVNGYFAQLIQMAGVCNTVKMATKLGLRMANGADMVKNYGSIPSFTLGAVEIAPMSLVEAYATFASRGKHCNTILIKSAKTRDGRNVPVPQADCKQVISEDLADTMNDILQGPFNAGTARSADIPGYQIAGKTGTETGAPTIWTMGYTPSLVGGAMITTDKMSDRFRGRKKRPLAGTRLAQGHYLAGNSGREAGGLVWKPAMREALALLPKQNFVKPGNKLTVGAMTQIPSCVGMGVHECEATMTSAGFSTRIVSQTSNRPKGTFLGSSPHGSAPKYSVIRLYVSSGPAPKPVAPPPTTQAPATTAPATTAPATKPPTTTAPKPQPTATSTTRERPGKGKPGRP